MSPESYRYYSLDSVGHLQGAEWFEAESDDVAVAMIRDKHPDAQCEIWQGRRLVSSVKPQQLSA